MKNFSRKDMNIYVGNLPYTVTESILEDLFLKYGDVSKVVVIIDRETRKSKGFGFVEMPDQTQAEGAIKALNDSSLKERNIKVSKAKPKGEQSKKPRPAHPKTRALPTSGEIVTDPNTIIEFWFSEITPESWWNKDTAFDQLIYDRFSMTHLAANRCELYNWRQTSRGRLAEIIVLDQFSRNMYRDTPLAFASDPLSLTLAQEAVDRNLHNELESMQRMFLLMPYMHSESKAVHEVAVGLFNSPGLEGNYEFELKHKAIIDQFGRYPHRNKILGRSTTEAERLFLEEPNSSF